MRSKLIWYAQRLARMSPAEIAFRVREQAKRWADRRRPSGWETVSIFPGPLTGLAAVSLADAGADLLNEASRLRDRWLAGQLAWLGQDWPVMSAGRMAELWTLDPVSGGHWPGAGARAGYRDGGQRGDVKLVWEPNRLQMLQPLALLAAQGDTAAEELGWEILTSWMDTNPPYEGVNWSSGIEAASRIVSVLVFLAGLRSSPQVANSDRVRRFLAAHAQRLWRYPSLHSSANNHRIAELASLLLVQMSAPGLKLGTGGLNTPQAELEMQVARQFHADGVGAEQSPTYAAYSIEWLTLAGIAADGSGHGVTKAYRDRLGVAIDHLRWLLDEAGRPPRLGDDDEGRVLALGLEPEPRYVASVGAMTARWLGAAGPPPALRDIALRDCVLPHAVAHPARPLAGARTFPHGGCTIVRGETTRGQTVLTIDHGPLGFLSIAAHGHADALSIALSWGDEPVLVDAGTYLYHAGGKRRDELRGTGVHNTLSIEAQDQSRIVGPFAWADHARTELLAHSERGLTARCLGWQRRFGVAHERRIDWREDGHIAVEDHLIGTAGRSLGWSAGLSLAPHCRVGLNGGVAELETAGGRRLLLRASDLAWRLKPSIYSPAFNRIEPIDRLELQGTYASGQPSQRVAAFTIELLP